MDHPDKLKSGEFLVKNVEADGIFIPEAFDEEQKMIAQSCTDFIQAEVYPILDDLDKGDRELMKSVLKKAGDLGLMGISLPEAYGGFGQSFVTQMLAAETIGAAYSFSVAFMAHCGIGTLPIMYYGSEDQRQKYVTRQATGEWLGAYCLTEPGAGSDANSGKTTATLSEDGKHYILNGQKMWITNAGFCDTQVVFAKIDKDRILSAFIVETDSPGVVIGPDEHKMGIKGSSTAQIYYNDVKVPVENLLGERGEGFRIALNILHMGRMKLGANVIGAAKKSIADAVQYANERKQFGVLISSFGAIKHKLAEMVIRCFAHESATYRVSHDIDLLTEDYKQKPGCDSGRASVDAISHFAVEDAILKVYGSEMLDFVVDEAVQIHGGMGYSAEMNVERAYRDSRINRIFEGTNEINRLLVTDTAMKRAMKGDYDLFGQAEKLFAKLDTLHEQPVPEDYFPAKKDMVQRMKYLALLVIQGASSAFGRQLAREQEVMNSMADLITEIYISESLALRVEKLETLRPGQCGIYRDMLDVYLYDSLYKSGKLALDAVHAFPPDWAQAADLCHTIRQLTVVPAVNAKEARRRVADKLIEDNAYRF